MKRSEHDHNRSTDSHEDVLVKKLKQSILTSSMKRRSEHDHNRSTDSHEDVLVKKLKQSFISDSSSTSDFESDDSENTSFRLHKNQNELSNVEYPGKGLKHILHGTDFQLKLLMLILWRAHLLKLSEFALATELPESEKFDDVGFFRRNQPTEEWLITLYQAKHMEAERNKLIKQSDLISSDDNNPFQLSKYMRSFEKIQKLCHSDSLYSPFSGAQIDELVIITNAKIQPDLLELLIECVGIEAVDKFIEFSNAQTKKYKINPSKEEEVKKLTQSFVESSDFRKLVKMLAHSAVKNTKIEQTSLTREYIFPLQNVLECNETKPFAKFTNKFLDESSSSEFREALIKEIVALRRSQTKDALAILKNAKIPISTGLAEALKIKPGQNISSSQGFGRQFYDLLTTRGYNQRIIINLNSITGTPEELELFKDNVCALGVEHVLVERLSKIRFSTSFIKGRIDNKSIMDFRKELIRLIGINFQSTLVQYSFDIDIKNFPAENEEYLERKLPEPYSESDCELFFDKLRLVVNYPNRNEITSHIGDELKTAYKNLNCEAVEALLTVETQNWMTSRTGTFYTAEKVDNMFREMDANVLCWSWHGMNKSYLTKCPKYKFKNQELNELIRAYLAKSDSGPIMSLMFDDILFGRIRVVQSFFMLQNEDNCDETLQRFSRVFGYIFLKLKQFSDQRFFKKFMKILRAENQWNLIVVECDVCKQGPMNRLKALLRQHGAKRKVILISRLNDPVPINIAEADQHTVSTSFDDLTESSWKIVGTKKVIFQSSELVLNDVIDSTSRHLIDAPTLLQLLKDEPIHIGEKLKYSAGYDPDLYISRFLDKVQINEEVKNCSDPDRVIISDSESDFIRSCKNSTQNIHWLRRYPDVESLIWERSYGSIVNIRKYRAESPTITCEEADLISLARDQKLIIISDTAGMGKTTILSSLSKELKAKFDKLWVIRINLNEHTNYLNAELRARDENSSKLHPKDANSSCDFLIGLLFPGKDPNFEMKLFKNALMYAAQLKVAVLLDGFDEISPDYAEIILDLLHGLQRTQLEKLIITTRPVMAERLERELNMFVRHFLPLNDSQKEAFLLKFWTERLQIMSEKQESRLYEYVNYVINVANEMISNPLKLRLLAEILEKPIKDATLESCAEFIEAETLFPNLPDNLISCDLYSIFVEKKIRIYHEEKMREDPSNVAFKSELDERLQRMVKKHQIIAVFELLKNDMRMLKALLLPVGGYDKLVKKINSKVVNIEKIGLINRETDGRLQFDHRTIAEYFLACYVGDALANERQYVEFQECFIGHLLRCGWFILFWETWLAKGSNRSRIADETKFQLGDTLKRLPEDNKLQLGRYEHTLSFFLECTRDDIEALSKIVTDRYDAYALVKTSCTNGKLNVLQAVVTRFLEKDFDKECFRLAVNYGNPDIWFWMRANDEISFQEFPKYAISGGNLDACKWLHSTKMFSFIDKEMSPSGGKAIHLAGWCGHIHIIKWLLSIGVEISDRDRNGHSVLHHAALGDKREVNERLILPAESGGYGMDLCVKDDLNQSLLHIASYEDSTFDVLMFLLDQQIGIDINSRDRFGSTPLHIAVMYSNSNAVQVLVENGADRNAVRNDGKTPLNLAACANLNKLAVEVLVGNGADRNAVRNDGETPLDLAACANIDPMGNKYTDYVRRLSDSDSEVKQPCCPLIWTGLDLEREVGMRFLRDIFS